MIAYGNDPANPSAADFLEEPIVEGRAVVVTVVPKKKQRRAAKK